VASQKKLAWQGLFTHGHREKRDTKRSDPLGWCRRWGAYLAVEIGIRTFCRLPPVIAQGKRATMEALPHFHGGQPVSRFYSREQFEKILPTEKVDVVWFSTW